MEGFIQYTFNQKSEAEIENAARTFANSMANRRSIRDFSDRAVPKETIELLLNTANNAPSGANKQPWTFCAVQSSEIKKQIRTAAQLEEYQNYHGRMGEEWLQDLEPLGTTWQKPFLEIAPWLVIIFKKVYEIGSEGEKNKNYYVSESVGIAAGFLITAIHQAGLVTLTHTPSPMNFLQSILQRPVNEKPFLLLPVGYPADGALVPDIQKKTADQNTNWF